MKPKKIIAIIPARGGSKSIPRKNVKLLGGRPLIAYPISLALSINRIDKVIVSTDDDEIMEIAKKFGAQVPFIRPKSLAGDETPTLPVIQHCLKYMDKYENYKPDFIVLLYPTSPFLKKKNVIDAINILEKTGCNTVISVVPDYGHYWAYDVASGRYNLIYPEKRVNRQYHKPLYKENGAIYFSDYETIMVNDSLVGKVVEFLIMDDIVDIDNPSDWTYAEDLLK